MSSWIESASGNQYPKTMPEPYNNLICLKPSELTSVGVISEAALIKYTQRNKSIVARKGGGKDNTLLLYWDNLKPEIRDRYRRITKTNPADIIKSSAKLNLEPDYSAIDFFATFILPDGRYLTQQKQKQLITNSQILNAVIKIKNERLLARKSRGIKTRDMWAGIIEDVKSLKKELNHSLQCSSRLKEQVEAYVQNGYLSLISAKFMNSNAAAVNDTERESSMRQLLRHHNNLDNEQIRSLYNIMAEPMGWKKVTAATVGNYRKKYNLETTSGRRGVAAFDNNLAMTVKRKPPTNPLYYWTLDGWDVELLYQATEIDADGNTRTTYHNRLTVVVVLDPFNKYPIGYAVGTHETSDLILSALRNAIVHTKELFGEHYKVLQLQSDRYQIKKLTPFYEAITDAKKYTPARVHNAKSKVIEPYFRLLNKNYCQKLMRNWSGFGITTNPNNQPNTEYLNKIHSSFPDALGCRKQIDYIIEQERLLKLDKYMSAFGSMPVDDKRPIKIEEFLFALGEKTGFTNHFSQSGLVVTLGGVKRDYDCFDKSFRQHTDKDWCVKYDPEMPSTILIVNAKSDGRGKLVEEIGTLRYLLTEKYTQPMALKDRQEGDSDQLQLVRGFNKTMKAEITEGMAKDFNIVDELFANNPRLNNTLAKLVLVDSNGQHKDNKAAERLAPVKAQKVLARQNKKLEAADQRSWAQQQEEYLNSKIDLNKYL